MGSVEIRNANEDDAHALSDLFRMTYGDSTHVCQDQEHVRQSIVDTRNKWFLAIVDGKVSACHASIWHSWNSAYETARSVTLPNCRGLGIGSKLIRFAIAETDNLKDHAFRFYFPRNKTILGIFKVADERHTLLGYDGGMHVANGSREFHLVCASHNRSSAHQRVIPPANALTSSSFVQNHIVNHVPFETSIGEYPSDCVVGPESTQTLHVENTHISCFLDGAFPSQSLQITKIETSCTSWKKIAESVVTSTQKLPSIEHMWMYVLADKISFIAALCSIGFRVTAYLPGWYGQNSHRFDCVMLVKQSHRVQPLCNGTQEEMTFLKNGFDNIFESTI